MPATSVSAPAAITRGAVSGAMPPSTDSAIVRPEASIIRRSAAIFGSCDGKERLAAESGIDRHHQDDVDEIEHPRNAFHRRRRIQHHAGPLAVRPDQLQRAVQMRPGLGMHQEVVGAGIGERRDERIDRRDHQMHVERQVACAGAGFSGPAGRS